MPTPSTAVVEDVVGFGDGGTGVTYGRANSTFVPAALKIRDFGVNQGWQMERHPRQLADVNDDGAADGVGFGHGGAWISSGRTDGTFTPPGLEVRDFDTAQGWRVDQHPRAVTDVTGDGRADIGGFGEAALKVPEFCYAKGWRSNLNPRALVDRDGDGVQDIVGVGFEGVYAAYGRTDNAFDAPVLMSGDYGVGLGWDERLPRLLGDVDGDGRDDVVGFGTGRTIVTLS